ncbi:MAG: hypothetical protein QG671_622, partial [Actinomycetota bacterium]|nr:hypothetical protein [Actinomycetota bacterium]
PADQGWQRALVSADVVIGDHGSVTFYAAALGLPLLLGAFGEEVVPGTPLDEISHLVPRLRWDRPLLPQVTRALARPAAYSDVAQAAFGVGEPGPFDDLRQFLYGILDLEPPAPRPPRAWPCQGPAAPMVSSFTVFSHADADGTLVLRRHPAAVSDAAGGVGDQTPSPAGSASRQLAVYDDETDIGRRHSASTLVCRDVLDEQDADAWLALHRDQHLITAVPTCQGILIADRYGGLLLASLDRGPGDHPWFEPMHAAAVVHHLLRASAARRPGTVEAASDVDRRLMAGVVTVRVAGRQGALRLAPVRSASQSAAPPDRAASPW